MANQNVNETTNNETTVNNEKETTMTITLTTEQQSKVEQLMATYGWTYQETIQRVIDRGIYDVTYRTKRNREEYAAFKAWKATK